MLSKEHSIKYLDRPYPVWIIDNLLEKSVVEAVIEQWPSPYAPQWHGEYSHINGEMNILERGMKSISKLELMPHYIAKLVAYFHGQAFTDFLENTTGIKSLISDKFMRWSGMRSMVPGSFQLIHSDARMQLETGLRKELTCLIYFNEDYEKVRDEGCLEVWNDEMTEKVYDVEPVANRLVIFLNSDTSYHGVPKVNSHRKMITFSVLKEGSVTSRAKALFVPRPCDNEQVKIQGTQRSIVS